MKYKIKTDKLIQTDCLKSKKGSKKTSKQEKAIKNYKKTTFLREKQ